MDIIDENGCNLFIKCPISFRENCLMRNNLEDPCSSIFVQPNNTYNITLNTIHNEIHLEIENINSFSTMILIFNYTLCK